MTVRYIVVAQLFIMHYHLLCLRNDNVLCLRNDDNDAVVKSYRIWLLGGKKSTESVSSLKKAINIF